MRDRAAAIGFVALFAAAGSASFAAEPEPLAVSQIAPGVYMHEGLIDDWQPGTKGDVANVSFVVGSRCVAVVDTGGSPEVGQRLRAAIERVTPTPVCYVINTHMHPDHVLGNVAFKSGGAAPVAFVANAKLQAALAAREPYYLQSMQREFGIKLGHDAVVYPTMAVEQTAELDLGGRRLSLRTWPTAHTDNDLTVVDEQTRTLFAGDLLFVKHLPVIDGSLRGWVAVLADLRQIQAARAVPGHGPVGDNWPAAMDAQQTYLETLLRETRAAIKSRMTMQQAVDSVGAESASKWQLSETFHRRNVTTAYAELEWED